MMALLLNAILVFGILLPNTRDVGMTPAGMIYFTLVVLGYYLLPPLVILVVLHGFFFKLKRTVLVSAGALITLYVFYLLLDSLIFGVFKFHLNVFWMEFLLRDFSGLGLSASYVLIGLGTLIGISFLEVVLFRWAGRTRTAKTVAWLLPLIVLLSLFLSQSIHIVAHYRNDVRITGLTPSLPFYVPTTSRKHAQMFLARVFKDGQEKCDPVDITPDGSLRYPLEGIQYDRSEGKGKMNVLIIMLESWREDMLNETVSPRMSELAGRSTRCLKHFSTGNQTTGGLFGFFYGLHPTYWGAVKANSEAIDNPVLIDAMRDNGYVFGIFADSNFDRHKIKDTIFKGIEVRENFPGRRVYLQDEEMTRQVLSFLDDQADNPRPFMSYIFFKASHYGYSFDPERDIFQPSQHLNMALVDGDTDPQPYLNAYKNAIHHDDRLVGKILDKLEELGMADDTMIIITSDHGEQFNDSGQNFWGHGSNYTRFQTGVPLVVHDPGRPVGTVDVPTNHIDVVPTLMRSLFACRQDIGDYSNGVDLFGDIPSDRPFVAMSYYNHAFIFGEDVFEVLPFHTRKYRLDDFRIEANNARQKMLNQVREEITCFYK